MKYLHNDRELLGAPRGHRTGVGKSACDGMIFSGGGGGGGTFPNRCCLCSSSETYGEGGKVFLGEGTACAQAQGQRGGSARGTDQRQEQGQSHRPEMTPASWHRPDAQWVFREGAVAP